MNTQDIQELFYYFIEQKLTDGTWVRTGESSTSLSDITADYKKLSEAPFAPDLRVMLAQQCFLGII